MKNLHTSILVIALSLSLSVFSFHLTQSNARLSETTLRLRDDLASRDRTIEELRGILSAKAAESSINSQGLLPQSRLMDNSELAAAQKHLENLAERIDLRMAVLERQLKRARLIPMTPQEHEAELQRGKVELERVRERLNAENQEVDRLVVSLRVPEEIAKLPPHSAINNPLYQNYRAYFAAKISAGYAESLVAASEQAIAHFVLEGPETD